MSQIAAPKFAVLSAADKTGLPEFAAGLHEMGWVLYGSAGTAACVAEADVPIGTFQELLGLEEGFPRDMAALDIAYCLSVSNNASRDGTPPISLAFLNLKPVPRTLEASYPEHPLAVDFGGQAMLAGAIVGGCITVVEPYQLEPTLEELQQGQLTPGKQMKLAAEAATRLSQHVSAVSMLLNRSRSH